MKSNLEKKEGRLAAMQDIEDGFINTLRKEGFDVAPDAVCIIQNSSIELGIKSEKNGWKIAFASEISLYAATPNKVFGRKLNEINFGSSGVFTPENRESYWRTIHAASILKNWDVAIKIINEFCQKDADLEKEIIELNKK